MHFDPFYPDPKNVLLQYIIDTSDIQVSENVAEALTNMARNSSEYLGGVDTSKA